MQSSASRTSVLGTPDCSIRAPSAWFIVLRFYSTLDPEKCHLPFIISGNELFGRRMSLEPKWGNSCTQLGGRGLVSAEGRNRCAVLVRHLCSLMQLMVRCLPHLLDVLFNVRHSLSRRFFVTASFLKRQGAGDGDGGRSNTLTT